MFTSLRTLTNGPEPVTAPLALNPLMARLAEQAGFQAVYLGGGASGYLKLCLEANLNLTEMAQAGMEIAATTRLPIILDGACGWGDPMHMHRTIPTAEAAGFAAIELEDQVLPKRAGHHAGVEALIPAELMEAKLREAVAARRDPEFVIIGRTNAAPGFGMDEALRRAEAYRRAGADMLLLAAAHSAEQIMHIGARLGPPLMVLAPAGGLAEIGLSLSELGTAGVRLVVDAQSLMFTLYASLKATYAELAAGGFALADRQRNHWRDIQDDLHETVDLRFLLDIEQKTPSADGGNQ